MRIIFVLMFTVSTVLFASCETNSSTSSMFSGKISGAKDAALTRVDDINRKKVTLVEQIKLADDGSFSLEDKDLTPNLYELNFRNGKKVQFFADGETPVKIEGDADKIEEIKITGPEANKDLASYEEFRKESLKRLVILVRDQIKALSDNDKDEFDRLTKLEVTNYTKHKDELLEYTIKNLGTSLAVYATSSRWPSDAKKIEPVVTAFKKEHPDLEMGKRLQEKLDVIKQTSTGGTVPDIRMRNDKGVEILLKQNLGKYTLIDFWGSWCGPCRRESRTLGELYAKYKTKGFEIFGVGLESDMQLWLKAKESDKRIWPNVLSLKEFETESAYDYAVTALPANFLIDENGKVIARDLHDEELVAKLEELFD